jgi:RimJ/RimL family protein N-acetyltransferase
LNSYTQEIALKSINLEHLIGLYALLKTDLQLQHDLGYHESLPTFDEFQDTLDEWIKKTKGRPYGIMVENVAVGMISLSHVNYQTKSTRIGYWIGSEYRKQGIMTASFVKILGIAREMGIKEVSCKILKNNEASLNIWKRFGAEIREEEDAFYPILSFDSKV